MLRATTPLTRMWIVFALICLLAPLPYITRARAQSPSLSAASPSPSVTLDQGSEFINEHMYNMSYDLYMCPTEITSGAEGSIFGPGTLFTAKIEDHPNSTNYEDVGWTTAQVHTILDSTIASAEGVVLKLAHYIKQYGSSYIVTTDTDTIAVMTTNSAIVKQVLRLADTHLAPPFSGLYGTYLARTDHHSLRYYGVSVGLTLSSRHATARGSYVGAADYTVGGCAPDTANCDGDVVCNPGAYSAGRVFALLPKRPVLVLGEIFDDGPPVTLDLVDYAAVGVPPPTLIQVGATGLAGFRMGDGIDDDGISGALPAVYSGYGLLSDKALTSASGARPASGYGRVKFAVFGCVTVCENNATHRLDNSPLFDAYATTPVIENYTFHETYVVVPHASGQASSPIYGNISKAVFFHGNGTLNGGAAIYLPPSFVSNGELIPIQFDPNLTSIFVAALPPGIRTALFTDNNITASNAGVYVNMREAPYDVAIFGFGVGAFFAAYPNTTVPGCKNCFVPEGVTMAFWDSQDQYIKHGYRVGDTTTLSVNRKFRVSIMTEIAADYESIGTIPMEVLGYSANNSYISFTQGVPGTQANQTTAQLRGFLSAGDLIGTPVIMTCNVVNCWPVFADAAGPCVPTRAGDKMPAALFFAMSGVSVVLFAIAVYAMLTGRRPETGYQPLNQPLKRI